MPLYRVISGERRLLPFRSIELGSQYEERNLEDWFEANPQALLGDEPLLIIGRQVRTSVGIADLLALDSTGATVTIELKRGATQREAVSQGLEYAAYFSSLGPNAIEEIASAYLRRTNPSAELSEAWQRAFNSDLVRSDLNSRQRIFVVVEGEDDRIASLVRFLRTSGVDITLLKYNYYRTESGEEILDLEREVGEEETATQPTQGTPPTEEGLVQQWVDDARQAYSIIRECFVSAGLFARAKKSGISFSKQTRTGQVFVCFVTSSSGNLSLWLRSDSLGERFDFQATARALRDKMPSDVQVRHTDVWFILTFQALPETAQAIAALVVDEILGRLG